MVFIGTLSQTLLKNFQISNLFKVFGIKPFFQKGFVGFGVKPREKSNNLYGNAATLCFCCQIIGQWGIADEYADAVETAKGVGQTAPDL